MPRPCSVCSHEKHDAINRALVVRLPKRRVAALHGLEESSVRRHERYHLPAAIVTAEAAERMTEANVLAADTCALEARAVQLLDRAERDGDVRAAVLALRESRECLGLRVRIAEAMAAREPESAGTMTFVQLVRLAALARSKPSEPR